MIAFRAGPEVDVPGFVRSFFLSLLLLLSTGGHVAAEQPCDRYPEPQQKRCEALWKQINAETGPEVAKFGLDQLKRRQEGKITAEEHLQENMTFIKQHAAKRMKLLKERMDKE